MGEEIFEVVEDEWTASETAVASEPEETVVEPKKSKWALKGRLKSWALWTAVAGLISIIFTALGLWEKIGITSTTFDAFVYAIGTVLAAFGIVNNPTDRNGF